MFNVCRRALTGIWEGTPRDAVSREGPRWLIEGSAEYFAQLATGPRESEACDLSRGVAIYQGEVIYLPAALPLSRYETAQDFWSQRASSRYSSLAVELLAERAGPKSIFAYYASLRAGLAWQKAFERAFGVAIEEFYLLFEERRAAGFPQPSTAQAGSPTPGPFDHLLQESGLPSYIKWDVESEVDRQDVESAILGVKLMHEFAQSLDLPDPSEPITITIYRDMEKMACKYSLQTGWSLELSRKYWERGGAVAGKGTVNIGASTPERLRADPHAGSRIDACPFSEWVTGIFGAQEWNIPPLAW